MNLDQIHIADKIIGALIPFQSLLFAIILFLLSKEDARSKRILAYYMLVNTLYFSYLFFFYSTYYTAILNAYYFIVPTILLVQPFFYLYIVSLTKPDFRCSIKQIPHLIPSLIILTMNIFLYSFLTKEEQLQLMQFSANPNNKIQVFLLELHNVGYHILFGLQALIYLIMIIRNIYKHKKDLATNFSNYEDVNLNWLITLLIIYFIGSTVQESLGYIDRLAFDVSARIYYNLFMLFIIAFIGISAIRQKEIYKNQCTTKDTNSKYQQSSLTEETKKELIEKLNHYLQNEKPYLNNDLKLEDIVNYLDTNRQYLSQIINETYGKNFYNLINDLRITECKKLFFNQKHKQLSIMGVANSVGFNSKSTFNTLFKKSTGLTPSQFIKENNL